MIESRETKYISMTTSDDDDVDKFTGMTDEIINTDPPAGESTSDDGSVTLIGHNYILYFERSKSTARPIRP